jgi:NAD-dependent SIR2 family protein deacetylase
MSYYEPQETRLAFVQCLDCDEIHDFAKTIDDLKDFDHCPDCKSTNLVQDYDYFW